MSHIRAADTKPEVMLRKELFQRGFRYRKNDPHLPGKPDIVLPKYRTVIFVNGCFWHMHSSCGRFHWPSSNVDYWREKIQRNVERDMNNCKKLQEMGWKTITVWECELKKSVIDDTVERVVTQIKK